MPSEMEVQWNIITIPILRKQFKFAAYLSNFSKELTKYVDNTLKTFKTK